MDVKRGELKITKPMNQIHGSEPEPPKRFTFDTVYDQEYDVLVVTICRLWKSKC